MICDKLDLIMEKLNLSNNILAKYSALNRTTISKYRSGSRKPDFSSNSFIQLIHGIISYSKDSEQSEILEGILMSHSGDTMEEKLRSFFQDDSSAMESKDTKADTSGHASFGYRLDMVMKLIGMTNVHLSHLLNVDASLISRYRSGMRSPKSNPHLMSTICAILYEKITMKNMQNEFAANSGIPIQLLDEKTLATWLFQYEESNQLMVNAAQQILYSLDSFTFPPTGMSIDINEQLKAYDIAAENNIYRGFRGLQSACIRFLMDVIQSEAKDIWLYSDNDTEWMTENPAFLQIWASLMMKCVNSGIHIHIIHNVNRDMNEMLSALKNWIPLYMTGMLDSYYCRHNNSLSFSHTMFLCPNVACINGMNIRGTETDDVFRYEKDKELLSFWGESFAAFKEDTHPLIQVFPHPPAHLEFANVIIIPDELLIRNPEAPDGFQRISIPKPSLKNIKIIIGDKYVGVTRLLEPPLTFYITNPLLCSAFNEFYKIYLPT